MTFALALAHVHGGFYLSSDLVIDFAPGFDFFGNSADYGRACDPLINPEAISRAAAGCPNFRTGWKGVFDGGQGIIAGVALGH